MARKVLVADSLSRAERRRVEAMRLAIDMHPNRYDGIDAYLRDAEQVEAWIAEANGGAADDLPDLIEARAISAHVDRAAMADDGGDY